MSRSKAVLFLMTVSLICVAGTAAIAKPRPVIELMLQKAEILQQKTLITLTLYVHAEVRDVSLSVALPLGLTLIEGETRWEGDLKAGQTKALKLVIDAGTGFMRVVEGRASVHFLNGSVLVKTRQLDLNEKSSPLHSAPLRQKGADGTVLEFRGP